VNGGWTPPLELRLVDGQCRLSLAGVARGEGATLQEASEDLVVRLLSVLMAVRKSGFRVASEMTVDHRLLDFMWELGELAASGHDIRDRLFG
jgi:hypothetical protein